MKTVFVINGFNLHRTATDTKFKPLVSGLEERGFRVVPVDISWRRKTPSEFAKEFCEIYKMHASDYNVVVGNSFGAVVALVTTPELTPDELYLCSLSPFFQEDRGKMPDDYAIKRFGVRRANDLWNTSFDDIARRIDSHKTKTTVVYGEREKDRYPVLVERNRTAARTIENARLYELPGAPHSIADKTYTGELLKLF